MTLKNLLLLLPQICSEILDCSFCTFCLIVSIHSRNVRAFLGGEEGSQVISLSVACIWRFEDVKSVTNTKLQITPNYTLVIVKRFCPCLSLYPQRGFPRLGTLTGSEQHIKMLVNCHLWLMCYFWDLILTASLKGWPDLFCSMIKFFVRLPQLSFD